MLLNLQKVRGTEFLYAMSFSLIQYLLRVIRTYYLFTEATGVTGILAEATWAIVGFNILLYMQGGHVSYKRPFIQFNSYDMHEPNEHIFMHNLYYWHWGHTVISESCTLFRYLEPYGTSMPSEN